MNYYKRMYVLSEEEYNRLKLQQKVPTIVATVDEPRTIKEVINPSPQKTNYTCPICDKSYKQKRDLRHHVKLVHAPPTKAIIPLPAPTVEAKIIVKKKNKTVKKKQSTYKSPKVFDQVKKWMTMRA